MKNKLKFYEYNFGDKILNVYAVKNNIYDKYYFEKL